VAVTLCKAICKYYKLEKTGETRTEMDDCEEEMLGNPALMKVGCDPSDGSDSEPSLCNLNFDKINKMSLNLTARPASENNASKKKSNPPLRPQSYKKASNKNIRQEIIFSTDKSRDISGRELSPSMPLRGSTAVTQRRDKAKGKLRTPKLEFTKEMQEIGKLGLTTGEIQKRPLRMINFELLIDESGKRKSSIREEGL
jgi:hypothetical protein